MSAPLGKVPSLGMGWAAMDTRAKATDVQQSEASSIAARIAARVDPTKRRTLARFVVALGLSVATAALPCAYVVSGNRLVLQASRPTCQRRHWTLCALATWGMTPEEATRILVFDVACELGRIIR
jgi:hypothetical protein